jgi:uncharacterized membrane protein YphA (DoxX/SURF4 family)
MLRKTIVLLVLLRLAIGWHFLVEGWLKLRSHRTDQPETNRPFSSEGYFRGATGPAGPFLRNQIGDLDDAALARLTVLPAGEGKQAWERIPPVVASEIDDYTKRFLESFNLNEADEKQAESKTAEAKEKVFLFLTTSVSGGQHITEYRATLAELNKLSGQKLTYLGRDQDNARLMRLKAEVAKARKEALDALDAEIGKVLRDELNGIIQKKLAAADPANIGKGEDPFAVLVPSCDGKAIPRATDKRWNDYFEVFKAVYPLTADQQKTAEMKLRTAKALTADWLAGKQAVPPSVVVGMLGYVEASPVSTAATSIAVREGLIADGRGEVAEMKRYLNAALTDDQAKGAPPVVKPEPTKFLRWVDNLTMWGLTIMGGCLLIGLLTRTNCVLAAGFLVLTYLASPPFPWLPAPPNNEGNYVFVNKNVVEMLGLLVLATTASGRWFGLDAILHRIFGREEPIKGRARIQAKAA